MACTIIPLSTDHDRLRFALMGAGQRMWGAREQPAKFPEAREGLVDFCVTELLPHLEHDEHWLIEAQQCPEGHLLAKAMLAETRTMTATVYELSTTTGPCETMALTRVLHTFLAAHDHHEKLLQAAVSST